MTETMLSHANVRVPRYTSYPPATAFGPSPDETLYRKWLSGLDPALPVAIYMHVPFCREVCWYCACNMKLVRREEPLAEYAATLERELELLCEALPPGIRIGAIHWGGGTPTSLPNDKLTHLTERIRKLLDVSPLAETAFELDPRTFALSRARVLAALGVNRVSLGVQEFDAAVQAAVNRIQPFEQVRDVVRSLRDAGIHGINFDLMYGLPFQTVATLKKTVAQTLTLRPDRIALFGYAHVPWAARRQTRIDEQALPGLAARVEQAERAAGDLIAGGYRRIGLDHFALPEDGLAKALDDRRLIRNFQGYVADTPSTVIGVGSSSISCTPQGYTQNCSETGAWRRAVEAGQLPVRRGHSLTRMDRLRREVINSIMCFMRADLGQISQKHGFQESVLDKEIIACRKYESDGLIAIDGRQLRIRERGRPALRLIASCFDAYLDPEKSRHALAV
jgi:oxygen-independent coproporphyrinogen III oxidase